MFEDWPVTMQPSPRRVIDPPRPVVVDLSRLIDNPDDQFRRDAVSMRLKAEGLEFAGQAPGHLHAWARSTRGGWLALVSCDVPTGNRAGKLTIHQWCPARAVTPCPQFET
jgi:hypothetical protein